MDKFVRVFPSSSVATNVLLLALFNRFDGVSALGFPAVIIARNGEFICSGALTDTETVVTAVDCVNKGIASEYRVLLDKSHIDGIKVKEIRTNKKRKGDKNNIALIHLERRAWKDGKLVRIQGHLPTQVYDSKVLIGNPRCIIYDPITTREIEVAILANPICHKEIRRKLSPNQVCPQRIRGTGKRDKCPQGLGTPIICKLNRASDWVQVGIHLDDGCTSTTMVATRLSLFRGWMRGDNADSTGYGGKDTGNKGDGSNDANDGDDTNGTDGTGDTEGIDGGDTGGIEETVESNETTTSSSSSSSSTTTTAVSSTSTTTLPLHQFCNSTIEFRCSDGTCISDRNVCDGKYDCPYGLDDESACGCPLAGTEFITGFMNNIGPEVSILYITAPETTSVRVTIPFLGYNETKQIQYAEKWAIENTTLIIAEKYSNKGVHIKSDKPITVIAANSREFSYSTVDGTIVYPLECLSASYLVEVQNNRYYKTSQYAIIGTQPESTNVTIVNKQGKVFQETLGFLDTYFLQEKDLRGTTIEASSNVVVLSGSECGYVPFGMTASCDHLVNQIPPRTALGNVYIVTSQKPRNGLTFRVQTAEDVTTITLRQSNGDLLETRTIDIGTEYVKNYLDSTTLSIESDKGIMVTQYAMDAKIDDVGQGDPSMVILPALNSFDTVYNFVVPDHFLRIGLTIYIGACHDAKELHLNGVEISTCSMTSVSIPGYGDYNVINVDVGSRWGSFGYATLTHAQSNVTFGAILYGTRVEGAFAWRIGGTL